MKIKSVDIIVPPSVEGMNIVVCRVNTDEGIYGLGETGVAIGVGGLAAAEVLRDMGKMIIGMNPLEHEVIWEKLYRQSFWGVGGGAVIISGISAIDTALWDLKGKFFGQPLYVLLGGKQREKLRTYASQLQMGWCEGSHRAVSSAEDLKEVVKKAVGQGYTAVKANVLGLDENGKRRHPLETVGLMPKPVLKTAEARLAAMRDAAGGDVDIILENHAITDIHSALQFARIAEPYGIMFYEEPAIPTAQEFKALAGKCPIPLATGERTYLRGGYLPFLQAGCLALIQPDIGNCGGVTEIKRICDMAYTYNVGMQAHVCSGPVSVAVSLHVEAALPNFVIHEHHATNTIPSVRKMGLYDYQPVDGYFDIPELPGIGQDLSKEALEASQVITVA